MKHFSLAAAALALGCLWACESKSPKEDANKAPAKPKAIELANLDTTIVPCDDFDEYVNGGWKKRNPIPASESRWGSFNELYDYNQSVLKKIAENALTAKPAAGSVEQLVGQFYAAATDSLAVEKAGIQPLAQDLKAIEAIANTKDLIQVLATQKMAGSGAAFTFYVYIDEKDSETYTLYFSQGGLGMPDRDYYLQEDEDKKKIRQQYLQYLETLFRLSGDAQAATSAADVMAFESKLATASKSRVALRDPIANYNKFSLAELTKRYPRLQVESLLGTFGIQAAKEVIVGQPDFLKALDEMVEKENLDLWKKYLKAHALNAAAPYLSNDFVKARFDFYDAALRGTKEMKPRWKRALAQTDDALGDAFGQLYVKEAFSPKAKAKMMELIDNLQYAFEVHIKDLDWMSDKTKEEALTKLKAFKRKIGYPDKWKDYTGLQIGDNYFQNVKNTQLFAFKEMVDKYGKPVDKDEWFMTPPTVNAYYNPPVNEIVFPAGILQAPFFDEDADDAVNYGGIGAVIGHELTHGFDDQGRQYDAKGNLRDWWQPEDAEKFKARANKVVEQFAAYEVLPNVKINGELTLGENIADLGGLTIAYTALQKALENKKVEKIDGFTPQQRFFISWAQVWRGNQTEAFLKQQVQTDSHSPAKYRINGPLSNLPAFYEAFGCKEGKLVKPAEQQIKIW